MRLRVQTNVTIPGFMAIGHRVGDTMFMDLDVICAHLNEVAEAFDDAHAIADIGRALRAVSESLAEAEHLTPDEFAERERQ